MFSGRKNWLAALQRRSHSSRRRFSRKRFAAATAPAIEVLEDRTLLSNISIGDGAVTEGDNGTTFVNFTVTRSANTTAETVTYTTNNGTATAGSDFTTTSGTINFAMGGALTATISVPVITDTIVEANETFTVDIINSSGGAVITDQQGVGTINNDDTATLTIANVTAAETDSSTTFFNFQITLNNAVSGGLTVNYATANGTATSGSDYVASSGTLTFTGNTGEVVTIPIAVNGDTDLEANETFTVTLSSITALGAGVNSANITSVGSPATGTITNDDVATLTINDVTQVETDSGSTAFLFSVTVDRAVSGGFSVNFATANATASSGSDYAPTSGTLNFTGNANETQFISVLVTGDTTIESDETFQVNLSGATGGVVIGDAQGIGTITNDDVAIPAVPTLTAPGSTTNDNTPTFTWNAVAGATSYELLVYNITTGQAVVNQTGITGTSFTPGTALRQGMHQAFLRAVNGTGNSAYSTALNFNVTMDAPIFAAAAASTTDTTPTIIWGSVTGAASYEILVYNISSGQQIIHQTGLVTNQFTPSSPFAQSMHQIFVRAFDVYGVATAYSAPQSLNVGIPTTTITGPSATVGDTTPTISWTPVMGAASYELLVYNTSLGQLVIHQTGITTTAFTPSSPLAVANHQAFVRAIDGSNVAGPWSAAHDFQVTLSASTITGPSSSTHDTTPTITWTAVDGAVDYELLVYHTATGTLVLSQTGIQATQFTMPTLAQGTHQAFVRATNGSGTAGVYSDPLYFNVVLSAPTLTSPAAVSGDRTPTFAWTTVSGAVSYQLLVYNVTTGQLAGSLAGITATQFTQQTPVLPGSYQVFVRAFDSFGAPSPFSSGLNFQIVQSDSDVPAELQSDRPQHSEVEGSELKTFFTIAENEQSLPPHSQGDSKVTHFAEEHLSEKLLDDVLANWTNFDMVNSEEIHPAAILPVNDPLPAKIVMKETAAESSSVREPQYTNAATMIAGALITLRTGTQRKEKPHSSKPRRHRRSRRS
ncbi:MAG: hypothetical protein Tsb009_38970 [Planctomycetaceae bacterium]